MPESEANPMSTPDMDLDKYEVIMRFPAPPPAFKYEDMPDEVAIVRLPNSNGGVMICGRLESKPWHDPKRWIANYGERAAVRHLLAEIERLKAENARLMQYIDTTLDGVILQEFQDKPLYCPQCGGEVEKRDSFTAYCPDCAEPNTGRAPMMLFYDWTTSKPMPDPKWRDKTE